MSTFWSLWIIGLTLTNLGLVLWVLLANRKVAVDDEAEPENRTTGHVYDGIEEFDNPMPKWWFQLFIATYIFAVGYLIMYPGMGAWKGLLGWTSHGEVASHIEEAQATYDDIFGGYAKMPIEELARDSEAMKMGTRLFANNCALCHGAGGNGNYGFPNLTDTAWLYGGTPEAIKQTITDGRNGQMPPWGPIIGEDNVLAVTEYVLKIAGEEHDATLAVTGESVFQGNCAACHMADGTGMHAVGAPNLIDDNWLYWDASKTDLRAAISHSVRNGRANVMPAQKDLLREEKIHLLSAYVYSLSLQD